jgi:hypothetical protein
MGLLFEGEFVVEGAFEAEGRVETGSVIITLDVIEDGGGGFISGHERPSVNQLVFDRTPKRLQRGVVVAVALATHGRGAAVRR